MHCQYDISGVPQPIIIDLVVTCALFYFLHVIQRFSWTPDSKLKCCVKLQPLSKPIKCVPADRQGFHLLLYGCCVFSLVKQPLRNTASFSRKQAFLFCISIFIQFHTLSCFNSLLRVLQLIHFYQVFFKV